MKKRIYIFILIFLIAAFSYKAQLSFKEPEQPGRIMDAQNLERIPGGENTVTLGR